MEILVSMNIKDLSGLEIIQRLSNEQLSQKEAGEILGLGTQQIKRLLKSYRKHEAVELASKHRS